MGVLIERSIDCMLAFGPDRLVVSVVLVVVSVVVQPTSANRPTQANHTIEFFIARLVSDLGRRLHSLFFESTVTFTEPDAAHSCEGSAIYKNGLTNDPVMVIE
jgi:hypothetical protein